MNKYQEIINSLSNCVQACEMCADACLEEDNVKMLDRCIRLNRDCADACSLGMKFLSRKSGLARPIISLCADICAKCAEECEQHDHEHCKECAEVCRHCEEICKEYLDNIRQAAMDA